MVLIPEDALSESADEVFIEDPGNIPPASIDPDPNHYLVAPLPKLTNSFHILEEEDHNEGDIIEAHPPSPLATIDDTLPDFTLTSGGSKKAAKAARSRSLSNSKLKGKS